jgi:glutathione synthase/RimK-type ligase-like ATP-grasp enzyme
MKKAPFFIGIKRKEKYSPNQTINDSLILAKTSEELVKSGAKCAIIGEDEIGSYVSEADCIFSMARGADSVNRLIELNNRGTLIVNNPKSVLNCYRASLSVKLKENGITFPYSKIVKTNSEEQYKISDVGERKIWLKRGDVHAIHREDVTLVYGDEELHFLLREFASRDIKDAVIQEHIYGDVIKFYAVKGTSFFYWYYVNGNNHFRIDINHLKSLAFKSADILDLTVYGGDAIVSEDGTITIIDINDWPSFAPIRDEASRYIASTIYSYALQQKEIEKA